MKYKVLLMNGDAGTSGNRGSATISFYTLANAQNCCEQYRQLGASSYAYLWDGSTWTEYAPIP